ncbi:MAG: GntR family transcriptional regulator [Pseudomonadota bacterium]
MTETISLLHDAPQAAVSGLALPLVSGSSLNPRLTLADKVFAQLQDAIVKGELAAGSRVSEAELVARYGVSRGPLREALRRLEGRQLITRIPHVGVRIMALSLDELLQIYQVRETLEGLACRLAAQHMSDAEIAGLKELLARHEQQIAEHEGRAYIQEEGNVDFHYCIIQGSHNAVLIQMLCGELYHRVRIYRGQFSVTEGRPAKALDEHRRIVEAIAARDGELAEFLMRRHIATARANIEARVSPSLPTPDAPARSA